jgi:hypothetical protein
MEDRLHVFSGLIQFSAERRRSGQRELGALGWSVCSGFLVFWIRVAQLWIVSQHYPYGRSSAVNSPPRRCDTAA